MRRISEGVSPSAKPYVASRTNRCLFGGGVFHPGRPISSGDTLGRHGRCRHSVVPGGPRHVEVHKRGNSWEIESTTTPATLVPSRPATRITLRILGARFSTPLSTYASGQPERGCFVRTSFHAYVATNVGQSAIREYARQPSPHSPPYRIAWIKSRPLEEENRKAMPYNAVPKSGSNAGFKSTR